MVYRQMRGRKIDVNFAIARGWAHGEGVIGALMQSGQAAARAPSPAGTAWRWLKCLRTSSFPQGLSQAPIQRSAEGGAGTAPWLRWHYSRLTAKRGASGFAGSGPFRERNAASDPMPSRHSQASRPTACRALGQHRPTHCMLQPLATSLQLGESANLLILS